MSSRKGITRRESIQDFPKLFVRIDPDVRSMLDDVAIALNRPIAVAVEEFVRNTPRDEATGLPVWAGQYMEREQLPLSNAA